MNLIKWAKRLRKIAEALEEVSRLRTEVESRQIETNTLRLKINEQTGIIARLQATLDKVVEESIHESLVRQSIEAVETTPAIPTVPSQDDDIPF